MTQVIERDELAEVCEKVQPPASDLFFSTVSIEDIVVSESAIDCSGHTVLFSSLNYEGPQSLEDNQRITRIIESKDKLDKLISRPVRTETDGAAICISREIHELLDNLPNGDMACYTWRLKKARYEF